MNSFTKLSFVRVSKVVPDFETRIKIVLEISSDLQTDEASSGSTFEIK